MIKVVTSSNAVRSGSERTVDLREIINKSREDKKETRCVIMFEVFKYKEFCVN